MVSRTELSSDALAPAAADALRGRVEAAGLFSMPDPVAAAPAHPDELAYEITASDAERSRTLRLCEGALPDGLRELIAWIDSVPERVQTLG